MLVLYINQLENNNARPTYNLRLQRVVFIHGNYLRFNALHFLHENVYLFYAMDPKPILILRERPHSFPSLLRQYTWRYTIHSLQHRLLQPHKVLLLWGK